MARIFLLAIALAGLVSAQEMGSKLDIGLFIEGLTDGFNYSTTSPSKCYNVADDIDGDIISIQKSIERVFKGDNTALATLMMQARELVNDINAVKAECDFSSWSKSFWDAVSTPTGQQALGMKIMMNMNELSNNMTKISNCSSNTYECGKALAGTLKTLFNWEI